MNVWTEGTAWQLAHAWLAPASPAEFRRCVLKGEPMHVRGGALKWAELYSLEAFAAFLKKPAGDLASVRAQFDRRRTPLGEKVSFSDFNRAMSGKYYAAGATVCTTNLSAEEPLLATLAQALRLHFGHLGVIQANAYWSPDGAGFDMHFDARVACTMQIHGSKTWTFSKRPTLAWPRCNAAIDTNGTIGFVSADKKQMTELEVDDWERVRGPAPDDLTELTLEPGDLLILPASTWHSASAVGASFAINMAWEPCSLLGAVTAALDQDFRREAAFRNIPFLSVDGVARELARPTRDALDTLIERLHEMRDRPSLFLDHLAKPSLTHRSADLPRSHGAEEEELALIAPEATAYHEDGAAAVILCSTELLRLPKLPFVIVEELLHKGRMRAKAFREALSDEEYNESDIEDFLQTLIQAGAIRLEQ
jgi:Cupin superfamily protein